MPRRSVISLGLLLLSLPSFLFVWTHRDDPHFGVLQDDGLYLLGAKSLADGSGYRILTMPGEPFQTKYPPLYPAYLSIAWRFASLSLAHLAPALLLSWLALPVVLALILAWCLRHGFSDRAAWILTLLFALNPWVLFFVANFCSEIFFMIFLFAAITLAERDRALLAGIFAGLAYLARTAGIALLPAAILYLLWKRKPIQALIFSAAMLPAVIGWTLWTRSHAAPGHDPVTLLYTNYTAFQWLNVGWDNLRFVLWNNISALLESIGSLLFSLALPGILAKLILQPLAVGMLLGVVRLFRQGRGELYAIFAVISMGMLIVWHYQPNQRFILPLAPLLLAGFWFEAVHLAESVRAGFSDKKRDQRIAAYIFAGFLSLMMALAVGLQIYLGWFAIPDLFAKDRQADRAEADMYAWIAANTPPSSNILWQKESSLYLATGRHSIGFVILPRYYYADPDVSELPVYRTIDQYARANTLNYVAMAKLGPSFNKDIWDCVAENKNLEKIYEGTGGAIYKLRNQ